MWGTSEPKLRPLPSSFHDQAATIAASVSPDRLREDVLSLAAPRNRLHSPEAMMLSEQFILSAFQDAGWQTRRRPYTLKRIKGNLDYGRFGATLYPELSGANLTAIKRGWVSNDTLIIEAHFDTVKMSPGADDNTASVAALMELARVLKLYSFKHTIMLAATDMEELGFIGATQLVKEVKTECKVRGAFVFETMAYTSKKPNSQTVPPGFERVYPEQVKRLKARGFTGEGSIVTYHHNGEALAINFGESLAHVAGNESVMLVRGPFDIPILGLILTAAFFPLVRNFYRADHYPFLKSGIPAIQITDSANFRNPNYHKISDRPETLDYEYLAKIVAATAISILRWDASGWCKLKA